MALKLPTGKPTAKQLAAIADFYLTQRNLRLDSEKATAKLKVDEGRAREFLINNLSKGEASGVRGAVAAVYAETVPEPVMEDREKFLKYVVKTGSFDLLTNAFSAAAVKERWEDKKKVPGIGIFPVVKLRVSKVK